MQERMKNPALSVPGAMQALMSLSMASEQSISSQLRNLIALRASQINGCSVCVYSHARDLKKDGESDDRIFAVAAWRDAPYFTDAERAALALTEVVTRLSDRVEPVPDSIWDEGTKHYDEAELASIILAIGLINIWNRLNVTTKQVAGAAW